MKSSALTGQVPTYSEAHALAQDSNGGRSQNPILDGALQHEIDGCGM